MKTFKIFLEDKQTENDAYATLTNFKFGIGKIPTRKEFNALLIKAKIVYLSPEEAIEKLTNHSGKKKLIAKGIEDSSVIKDLDMTDQKHDSWESILHHANNNKIAPLIAIKHKNKTILLDGDHRLIAKILTNKSIPVKIINNY